MKTLKTSLPLLNAMVVFEAAARRGGLTPAAEELNVAQSAVSRHVANLERRLSIELFRRTGNRVVLTEAGSQLAESIREGLGTIRQTVERLTEGDRETVVIGCGYDTAQVWLVPRFDLITSLIPSGRVMLLTSNDYRDLDRPEVTLSVRFGKPADWPGYTAQKLLDGRWFPVCSPAFLARYPKLKSEDPRRFLEVPLLHMVVNPGDVTSWQSWIGTDQALEGARFSSYLAMMHEAIAGRGAALAWAGFVEEPLKLGQLVRLTKDSRRHEGSFHVLTRKKCSAEVMAVARALIDSVQHPAP